MAVSDGGNGPPELTATPLGPSTSLPDTEAGVSWFGVPRFEWSLGLLGLCIFTFSVVTYRLSAGDLGVGIALVGIFLQRDKIRIPLPVWFYGAFIFWAFLASFASSYPDLAISKVVDALKLLVIMVIIVNALRTRGQLRFYLLFFLGCYVLFPARGTLVGGEYVMGRIVWNYIYSNSNDLATLCILALGVALGFMFSRTDRTLVRIGAGMSAILLLVVILLTQSRGAFIGLVAGMGPALLVMGIRRPVRLLICTSILALIIGLTIPASVWERLSGIEKLTSASTIDDADQEGSAAQRFEIQKVAMRILIDHPVFGIGLGAYKFENERYAPELGRRDTHNTYLNVAAEVGLPGFLLWGALVLSVLRHAYRKRRHAAPGALTTQQAWLERALWAYLIAAMFGTYAALTFPYLMLAVVWCSASLLAPAPVEFAARSVKA